MMINPNAFTVGTYRITNGRALGIAGYSTDDTIRIAEVDPIFKEVKFDIEGFAVYRKIEEICHALAPLGHDGDVSMNSAMEDRLEQEAKQDQAEAIARIKIATPTGTYYSEKYYDDEIYDEMYPLVMGDDFDGNDMQVIEIPLEDQMSFYVLDKNLVSHVDLIIEYIKK